MHKCTNCGTEFEGNFCTTCGTKYVEPAVAEAAPAQAGNVPPQQPAYTQPQQPVYNQPQYPQPGYVQPGYVPPPAYAQPQPPKQEPQYKEGKNTIALVGFIMIFFGVTSFIGFILCIVGFVQSKNYRKEDSYRGLALAGIIIPAVEIVLGILIGIIVGVVVAGAAAGSMSVLALPLV